MSDNFKVYLVVCAVGIISLYCLIRFGDLDGHRFSNVRHEALLVVKKSSGIVRIPFIPSLTNWQRSAMEWQIDGVPQDWALVTSMKMADTNAAWFPLTITTRKLTIIVTNDSPEAVGIFTNKP